MVNEPRADRVLPTIALALTCLGAIMVYSSTALQSLEQSGADYGVLLRHLVTLSCGLAVMVFLMKFDYRHLETLAVPFLVLSALLLLCVFVPGIGAKVNGSRRWIRWGAMSFQPSELVKLALVIFLARYVSRPLNNERSSAAAIRDKMTSPVHGVLVPLLIVGLFQGVLLLQPDFGSVVILGTLAFTVLFIGGVRLVHFLGLVPFAAVGVAVLLREPYRLRRITAFLDPWKHAEGDGYQLVQSLISFGSGGLGGVGLGEGSQKLYFLPEPHTDFIFSMVGEELGFVGAVAVVLLFILFLKKGVSIAREAPDRFGETLGMGLTVAITIQALVNFAVTTGMLPTKGLALPFISYGGSSMLVSLASVGILVNISKHAVRKSIRPHAVRGVQRARGEGRR